MFDVTRDYSITPRTIGGGVSAGADTVAPTDAGAPYSPWRSLLPKWWTPVIGTTSVDGKPETVVGVSTSGADVLGRHSYQATVTNRTYAAAYSYDRFYPTFSVLAARWDEDLGATTETTQRVIAQVTIPYRRFQWVLNTTAGLIRDEITGLDTLEGYRLGAIFSNAHEYLYSFRPSAASRRWSTSRISDRSGRFAGRDAAISASPSHAPRRAGMSWHCVRPRRGTAATSSGSGSWKWAAWDSASF
jgi:hypothetical protein